MAVIQHHIQQASVQLRDTLQGRYLGIPKLCLHLQGVVHMVWVQLLRWHTLRWSTCCPAPSLLLLLSGMAAGSTAARFL